MSTYPVATAHLIGLTLSRISGVPWVADFRDPIVDGRYSSDTIERRARRWLERKTLEQCSMAVFTTEGARRELSERYPSVPAGRLSIVANGYEEAAFDEVERIRQPVRNRPGPPYRLIHSGALYPDLRNPGPLFRALAELKYERHLDGTRLCLVFRASGDVDYYRQLAFAENVDDMVTFESGIPYRDALSEMLTADGLLLIQASEANHQIPAKLYEYLRARRPILALTDRSGETAALLKEAGIDAVAEINDVNDIKSTIRRFLSGLETNAGALTSESFIQSCSRMLRAADLAKILDSLV